MAAAVLPTSPKELARKRAPNVGPRGSLSPSSSFIVKCVRRQSSRGAPVLLDEAETARCVAACRAHLIEQAAPAGEELARAWVDVVGEALQRQQQSSLGGGGGGGGGGGRTQSPEEEEDKPDGRRHKCELSSRQGTPRGQESVAKLKHTLQHQMGYLLLSIF